MKKITAFVAVLAIVSFLMIAVCNFVDGKSIEKARAKTLTAATVVNGPFVWHTNLGSDIVFVVKVGQKLHVVSTDQPLVIGETIKVFFSDNYCRID